MKQNIFTAIALAVVMLGGCATKPFRTATTPLWDASPTRDKIVVCSDIHIGVEDAYAENVANRPYFVEFVNRLAETTDVRELVLNGDFLDEWYLPLSYVETDRTAFYQKNLDNNPTVIKALKNAIASGIKVVYIVGNHDMSIKQQMIEQAIPGIIVVNQPLGVGLYRTGDRGEIALEHGHRYDVYSAPDTITNAAITTGETMLPPGYWYARYAADWVIAGKPSFPPDISAITTVPDKTKDRDQYYAYAYYRTLAVEFTRITLGNAFSDKIFDIQVDGYNGTYSLQDLFPVLNNDGKITAPLLYPNYQRTWDARQEANGVKVKSDFGEAALGALGGAYFEKQARMQYDVDKTESPVEVVSFGHTHIPEFYSYGPGRFYINNGTWIDHNTNYKEGDGSMLSRTFTVITTGAQDKVDVYQYQTDGNLRDIKAMLLTDHP